MEYGIFSILPILITLVIVFVGKNVFLAILSGIFSAAILIGFFTGDYLTGMESIAMVFSDSGTAMTTFFVLMTGAIMCVVSRSGGVEGLVLYCTEKRKLISSPVAAQLISFVLGLLLFVDGTSSIAVTAMVGKPFFKKFGVSNEKLALISNSTGAAVAWLIPFGSACAVLTAFFRPVAQQLGIQEDPFSVVMSSTIFQFYTLALLPLVFLSIVFGLDLGGMGKACRQGGTAAVLVPVLTPIMVPVGIPAQFVLGVIISGAVFGDQNSPISDSVILTSSMTGVKIMDHVKTQMPYTLVAWAIALAGYIILGAACL